jgi:hypothetical protein
MNNIFVERNLSPSKKKNKNKRKAYELESRYATQRAINLMS